MQPDINPNPRQRRRINIRPSFIAPVVSNPANMQQFIVRTTGSKRPVDKQLVVVTHSTINATQQNTTLVTVTFPCTIVGIRWDIAFIQDGGTGIAPHAWCINVLRDGGTQKVMSLTDGSTFFAPESDCLTFGTGLIDNNVQTLVYNGSTKTMRKMMGGDKLIFSSLGAATETSFCRGVIQFFCKT